MSRWPLDERLRRRRRIAAEQAWRPANVCNPFNDRPACDHQETRRILSAFQRLLEWDRDFVHRAAIASLRGLDDRALRNIGLERSQVEAAVYGFITLSDQRRMS
jgi:uncharacterized protein YjiS (DUF1127 family)